jgi:tetratricopeptide (TPR) repeat protein
MSIKSSISFFTLITALILTWSAANGNAFQVNPLTKAIQLFDKEKYTEAEPLFKNILENRPDDFMVNYFYGACRTENGHYGQTDLNYLIKASKEVNPLNIDYYLGIQYHAKNQFEKALAYYKLFKAVASANDQEKVNLSRKMEQCANGVNPFVSDSITENTGETEAPVVEAAVVTEVFTENGNESKENELTTQSVIEPTDSGVKEKGSMNVEVLEASVATDSINQNFDSEIDESPGQDTELEIVNEEVKPISAEEKIKFSVNDEITYNALSNFKTEEGKNYFDEGTLSEKELQKVLIRIEILREKYKISQSRAERDSIGQLILSLEGESYDIKNNVTQLFMQAKNAENGYWINASPQETDNFIRELNNSRNARTNKTADVSPSAEIVIPPILFVDEEVKSDTPKDGNSGITYKIQLGAYSRGIPNSLKAVFNKISIIRKVENYTDENGVVVYTTGNLTNYDDAVVMQKQVRQEGIKDPIIAAYLNGKRITLEQAKEMDNNR